MRLRTLFLALLVCSTLGSTWAAALCCQPSDACCEDERSSCPVLPNGECAVAAAAHAPAIACPSVPQSPPALSLPVPVADFLAHAKESRVTETFRPPRLPRFLILESLRN